MKRGSGSNCFNNDELARVYDDYESCRCGKQATDWHHAIKRFESRKKAVEKTGVNPASISLCCAGKRKTGGGYIWSYFRLNKSI